MRVDLFGPRSTGSMVALGNAKDALHAFIPNNLPPAWEWQPELWPLLLEAHKALASLDGTGKHLPNPALILRPLQNREAQKSSRLEGTFTEPKQQALFDLDPKYPDSANDPTNARREVHNYSRALRYWHENQDKIPISLRLIRELHRILMDGVRGSDKNPGQFRTMQNQIGKPARFVPPPPQDVKSLLDRFEKYLHAERGYDPLVDAFLVHYQFEAIHPFMDGNGRVGRLLLAILIEEWCGLSDQWLYMSAYFDNNKDTYMDLLFRVSTDGAWQEWIKFCLVGVVEAAKDTQQRCDRLLEVHKDFQERLEKSRGSVRLASIVEDLFDTPVAVVARVRDRFGVSYPTASTDLKRLHKAGILQPLEGAPQSAYYCPSILQITYSDD
jgi:Fic family protein